MGKLPVFLIFSCLFHLAVSLCVSHSSICSPHFSVLQGPNLLEVKITEDSSLMPGTRLRFLPDGSFSTRISDVYLDKNVKTREIAVDTSKKGVETKLQKPSAFEEIRSQIQKTTDKITFSGSEFVVNPSRYLNFAPVYPHIAKKRGWEGDVLVRARVDENGNVLNLQVIKSSGFHLLDKSALKAVKNMKFSSALQGQNKVPSWLRIPVTFKLTSK